MKKLKEMFADWETRQKNKFNVFKEFFHAGLSDFQHPGSLWPSSRFACDSICKQIPDNLERIFEYGSGNGVLTRKILEKLPENAHFFGIEINSHFGARLSELDDARFKPIIGDVVVESGRMKKIAGGEVDVVVSGIPFSFLSKSDRMQVIDNTWTNLRPSGRFIVYQNSIAILPMLKRRFKIAAVHFELRNLPPYFIMVATK